LVQKISKWRFQDVVLTSSDGQSAYGKSLTFFEDLAYLEETLTAYEQRFKPSTLTLQRATSKMSEVQEEYKAATNKQILNKENTYEEDEEEEDEAHASGIVSLKPNGQSSTVDQKRKEQMIVEEDMDSA
jgi:hypothetical protein